MHAHFLAWGFMCHCLPQNCLTAPFTYHTGVAVPLSCLLAPQIQELTSMGGKQGGMIRLERSVWGAAGKPCCPYHPSPLLHWSAPCCMQAGGVVRERGKVLRGCLGSLRESLSLSLFGSQQRPAPPAPYSICKALSFLQHIPGRVWCSGQGRLCLPLLAPCWEIRVQQDPHVDCPCMACRQSLEETRQVCSQQKPQGRQRKRRRASLR